MKQSTVIIKEDLHMAAPHLIQDHKVDHHHTPVLKADHKVALPRITQAVLVHKVVHQHPDD